MNERGSNIFLPLSQNQIDYITQSFKAGESARTTARLVPCAVGTVWKYYQMLRNGDKLAAYDKNAPKKIKVKKPTGPKPGYNYMKSAPPRGKRPLVNQARFYKSDFVPT